MKDLFDRGTGADPLCLFFFGPILNRACPVGLLRGPICVPRENGRVFPGPKPHQRYFSPRKEASSASN